MTPYPFIKLRGRYMRVVFSSPLGGAANLHVSMPGPLWVWEV